MSSRRALTAYEPPTIERPRFEAIPPPPVASLTRSGPCWYDVDQSQGLGAVSAELTSVGLPVGWLDRLRDADRRVSPDRSASDVRDGCYMHWAFAAAHAPDPDDELVFYVDLQPLTILVGESFLLTTRLPGCRYTLGTTTEEQIPSTTSDPADLETLVHGAQPYWRDAAQPDRDVLFFSVLQSCVMTMFEVRRELALRKTDYDTRYYRGVLSARRAAATADLSVTDVNERAWMDSKLTDDARRRLLSVQHLTTVMRKWFDDLKPPGRGHTSIWIPDTTRHAEAKHLVERIYQVRNDLQRVRTETNESMAMLMTADTGGQLLAVRALLDRTEAARNAAIVAGAMTVIIAAVALAATFAAVPTEKARFSPFATAIGLAGALIVLSAVIAASVAYLSQQPAPSRKRAGALHRIGIALLAVSFAGFVFAYADALVPQSVAIAVGAGAAWAGLLLLALLGDFGKSRAARAKTAGAAPPTGPAADA